MVILLTPGARAEAIQFDTQNPSAQKACLDQAQKDGFLIRFTGDRESPLPGARLWNLDKLARASTKNDDCTAKLFAQGLGDQTEYWKYIAKKYGCDKEAAKTQSRPCTLYEGNAKYLDAVHKMVGEQIGSNGCEPASSLPGSPQVGQLKGPIAAVAIAASGSKPKFKPLPAYCKGNVPPNELRSPNDPNLSIWELNIVNAKDCGIGIWDFIRSTGFQIASAYKAIRRVGFFHGLALLSQDIVRHPGDVNTFVLNYIEGTFRYFTGDITDMVQYWSCYKDGIRTQKACSQLAKWAVAYLTGRLVVKPVGGVIGKGMRATRGWVGKQLLRVPGVNSAVRVTAPVVGAVSGRAAAVRAAATAAVKRAFSGKAVEDAATNNAAVDAQSAAPRITGKKLKVRYKTVRAQDTTDAKSAASSSVQTQAAPQGKLARLKNAGKKLKAGYHSTVRTVWGAATISGAVENQKATLQQTLQKAALPGIKEKMKRQKEEELKREQQNKTQPQTAPPAPPAP